MERRAARQNLSFWVWPLVLIIAGILLLLRNYLLLDFDVWQLWPFVLIVLGVQIALGGDPGNRAAQSFRVSRGSVEAATLQASSGDVDIRVNALEGQEGRLIAGQYTANSRPELATQDNRAIITMQRGKTWFLSLADWEIDLATDLPWEILASTYLGEISGDLRGLIIDRAHFATGLGDIRLITPDRPAGPLVFRSTLGNIHLTVPAGMEASLTIQAGPLFTVKIEDARWRSNGNRCYVTAGYASAVEPLDLVVVGTFGGLTLS